MCFGTKRSGVKLPARGEVIFEEVERDVHGVEQPVGDLVVAALGVPLAAAVAAAQMHADPHAGRRVLEHAVGDRDVLVDQRAPVVAARLQPLLHVGIAELGEGGLVDLDIAAAGGGKRVQLLAERLDGVLPELVEVLVGALSTAASPPRKCSAQGPGMVIFGTSRVLSWMNLKSGTLIGWVQRTRLLISATRAARRDGQDRRPWRPRRRPCRC